MMLLPRSPDRSVLGAEADAPDLSKNSKRSRFRGPIAYLKTPSPSSSVACTFAPCSIRHRTAASSPEPHRPSSSADKESMRSRYRSQPSHRRHRRDDEDAGIARSSRVVEATHPSRSVDQEDFQLRFDAILTLITGGIWLIWIFAREMRRCSAFSLRLRFDEASAGTFASCSKLVDVSSSE